MLLLLLFKNIFNESVRPVIGTSAGPIFTQFAGLVELIDVKETFFILVTCFNFF